MPLPASGVISFSDVNTEIKRGQTSALALNDDVYRRLAGISTTSATTSRLSDCYGDSNPTFSSYSITSPAYYNETVTLSVTLNKVAIQTSYIDVVVNVGTPYNQTYSFPSLITINPGSNFGSYSFTPSSSVWANSNTISWSSSQITNGGTQSFTLSLSNRPVPTYTFTTTPSGFNENNVGYFVVTTTNVPDSTTLYLTVLHGTTNASDFYVTTGSAGVFSNSMGFYVYGYQYVYGGFDGTEGTEYFYVQVRTGSTTGPVVATSNIVYLYDSPPPAPPPPVPPPPPPPPPPGGGGGGYGGGY